MRIGSIEFEKRGRIAIITLDEPLKLNAISMGIREGVKESLRRIEGDDDIRVGILTGGGRQGLLRWRRHQYFSRYSRTGP